MCYGRALVRRGASWWGPASLLVLTGIGAAAVVPASGPAVVSTLAAEGDLAGGAAVPSYQLKVDAVAYHLSGRTASGAPVGKGVVAVDPKLIPLGTRLFVPGYGRALAADIGVGIKGRVIDLWMPSDAAARKWGRKSVVITVFR
jgi:3D (Asp-Asp-Asp) domain-containing protein